MLSSSGGSSIVIDATNLSSIPADQAYLGYLIAKAHERGENYLPELTDIPFPELNEQGRADLLQYGPIPEKTYVVAKLIGRPRGSDPLEYRYDVYRDKIDGGCFGGIEKVVGTLAPQENNRVEFKPKDYIAKIQDDRVEEPTPTQESLITQRMPPLKSKPITFFSQPTADGRILKKTSIVMRRINGENLDKFLKKDHEEKLKNENSTPTDKRLEYCLAIAKALKLVHSRNVVHRDMKPANTMLVQAGPGAVVVDFGLSRDVRVPDKYVVGTPIYAPPEYWGRKLLGIEGDIFGLAWQLARVMRGDDNPSMTTYQAAYYASHCHFDHLFTGIDDLQSKHKDKIASILAKMVVPNPQARCSLNEVIAVFEEVLLERKMAKIVNKEEAEQVACAFKSGVALRAALDAFANKHTVSFASNIESFKTVFIEHLKQLPNFPNVFAEFIHNLDIQALKHVKTKEDAITTVEQLVAKFVDLNQKLEQMRTSAQSLLAQLKAKHPDNVGIIDEVDKWALEKIIYKISLQLDRHVGGLTLDAIARANHQAEKVFERHIENLRSRLKTAKHRGFNVVPIFKPYSTVFFNLPGFSGKVKIFDDYRPLLKAKEAEENLRQAAFKMPIILDDYKPIELDPLDASLLINKLLAEVEVEAESEEVPQANSPNLAKITL